MWSYDRIAKNVERQRKDKPVVHNTLLRCAQLHCDSKFDQELESSHVDALMRSGKLYLSEGVAARKNTIHLYTSKHGDLMCQVFQNGKSVLQYWFADGLWKGGPKGGDQSYRSLVQLEMAAKKYSGPSIDPGPPIPDRTWPSLVAPILGICIFVLLFMFTD